jgi:tRNA (guanine-N7-)-methyltransferase
VTTRRRSVFADRLLEFPRFVFSDGAEFKNRGVWRDHFSNRIKRLIVEIGCNDAGMLAAVAAKHPDVAFVGIDWKCRALHTAAERVAAAKLRNAALLHGRGQDIRRMFADGEIDELWLFHPDPCDKPKELANRLFAERFLLDVATVLKGPGSLLVLKTDHREYYQSSLSVAETRLVRERFEISASSGDFWADNAVRSHASGHAFAGEETSFETRFRRKRKPIHYLELRRR